MRNNNKKVMLKRLLTTILSDIETRLNTFPSNFERDDSW